MALDSGYFEVSNPVKTNADRIRSMSDGLEIFVQSAFMRNSIGLRLPTF